jgi:outer membrane protein
MLKGGEVSTSLPFLQVGGDRIYLMKRAFAAIFLVLIISFSAEIVSAGDVKIGVIDLTKVIEMSDEGKKAKKEMSKKIEDAEGEVKKFEEKLVSMKIDIEKEAMLISDEELEKREREYQDEFLKYQRIVEDYQNEIKEKDTELAELIISKTKEIVDKIGEEEGYTVILEETDSMVLYHDDAIDISDRVIRELNR